MNNYYKPIYSKIQEKNILSEFERTKDICYLEHAGATLYSEKQISNILCDLTSNIYANPHAKNTSSKLTEDSVDQIRYRILNHFNVSTSEYSVVFTNGATGALKLVSESFNYNNGCFIYLQDNHTSVLGMRNNAPNIQVLNHDDAFELLSEEIHSTLIHNDIQSVNSLFVYPAQCNFSGTKYPLTWIENIQKGALNHLHCSNRWFCCLDAAAYVSTNFLDLSKYKPDFVCISCYKLFGYPTGLGALLVRNASNGVLLKKYYGGGTVLMALSMQNVAIPRSIVHERFEDGTISFLDIVSLKHGFDTLKRLDLNMDLISKHTFSLAKYVYNHLLRLHHSNGQPAVVLYHDTTFEDRQHQGGIVNFNLRRSNGQYIGYAEVMNVANLFKIQLRTGCFCNPGSCQRHLKLSTNDVIKHFERGHVCGDQNDLIDGTPTGSVRISFGYMSIKKDADEFLEMIEDCFVEKPCRKKLPADFDLIRNEYQKKFCVLQNDNKEIRTNIIKSVEEFKQVGGTSPENLESNPDVTGNTITINGILESIHIYPIKSCGVFKIQSDWSLTSMGLKYDREWMIINQSGVCLTQKNNSDLCRIKPYINLHSNMLELHFEGVEKISVPLNINETHKIKILQCRSKVCGDPIIGWDYGDEVSTWLDKVLRGKGLRLMKQSLNEANMRRKKIKGESMRLSLNNQAQFLVINKKSVEWLHEYLVDCESIDSIDDTIGRFRANFVVDFEKPFIENNLREFSVNDLNFKAIQKCARCEVICIDQKTGEKSVDLLRIISNEFNGKICFGIYCKQGQSNEGNSICTNSNVAAVINVM